MFTFGADPEIFISKNGKPVSAHGLIAGTKKEPFKVENGAVQVDGMALEFNIDPVPSADFVRFNNNIVKVLAQLKVLAKARDPKINFKLQPVADFGEEYLAAQPDEAKELGCDPDYNAYTLQENPRPDGDRPFRTAAGHLHIGWGADIPVDNPEHMKICAKLVKNLDKTVGMFMTFLDREPRRRELYGKAGAFRPKPYGVEYRQPSNVWLKSKTTRKLVHILMNEAINLSMEGRKSFYAFAGFDGYTETDIQSIINAGDHQTAEKILDRYAGYAWPFLRNWEEVKQGVK